MGAADKAKTFMAFGKPFAAAKDDTNNAKHNIKLLKGFRLLAHHCFYGEHNAVCLSNYNQVFFKTIEDTCFNENVEGYNKGAANATNVLSAATIMGTSDGD